MPKLAKDKYCTGCMACVDACHHNAITAGVRKGGQIYPVLDSSKCVDCRLCENVCPIVKPVALNELSEMKVYGGWANEEQVRLDSASEEVSLDWLIAFFIYIQVKKSRL